MRDIIFVVPQNYGLQDMQSKLPLSVSSILNEAEERLTIQAGEPEGIVELEQDSSVAEYYVEPNEIDLLKTVGHKAKFFVVHFKNIEKLKIVIGTIANRSDVLIDNDFGLIESGDKFVLRCKLSPNWDWAA